MFNITAIVTATIIALNPTANRPSLDTIVVEGADYAGVQPEPAGMVVVEGVPLAFGFAWVPQSASRIVFTVEPDQDYTVHAFTVDAAGWPGTEPIREETVIELPVETQSELNHAMYQLFMYQERVRQLTADPDVSYFMVSEAIAYARVRLDNEE